MKYSIIFIVASISFAAGDFRVERHPEHNSVKLNQTVKQFQQKDFAITSYESELAQIERSASRLEEKKERVPRDSARYVDLDKNLSDIYLRTAVARKTINEMKTSPGELNDKDRSDLETLLADVREIINWNTQPSE